MSEQKKNMAIYSEYCVFRESLPLVTNPLACSKVSACLSAPTGTVISWSHRV